MHFCMEWEDGGGHENALPKYIFLTDKTSAPILSRQVNQLAGKTQKSNSLLLIAFYYKIFPNHFDTKTFNRGLRVLEHHRPTGSSLAR